MSINYNDYVLKVSTATPLGLTILTFELAICHIDEAISSFDIDNLKSKEQCVKAQKFVRELMGSLDMQYEISESLMSLYIYINRLLIDGDFGKNIEKYVEAKKILNNLMKAFGELKENDGKAVMQNVDSVYAGLTYSKGKLNEYVDTSNSKGFKA